MPDEKSGFLYQEIINKDLYKIMRLDKYCQNIPTTERYYEMQTFIFNKLLKPFDLAFIDFKNTEQLR